MLTVEGTSFIPDHALLFTAQGCSRQAKCAATDCHSPLVSSIGAHSDRFCAHVAFIGQDKPTRLLIEKRESKGCRSGAQQPLNRRFQLVSYGGHGGAWVWALGLAWVLQLESPSPKELDSPLE